MKALKLIPILLFVLLFSSCYKGENRLERTIEIHYTDGAIDTIIHQGFGRLFLSEFCLNIKDAGCNKHYAALACDVRKFTIINEIREDNKQITGWGIFGIVIAGLIALLFILAAIFGDDTSHEYM